MTPQITHGQAATLLEQMRARDDAAAIAARELAAELAILTRYDLIRNSLGHDYGGGQRRGELTRIERELSADLVSLAYAAAGIELPASMLDRAGDPFTPAELRAAFERVARPRIARLNREGYRHGTRASDRTIRGWERVTRWLEGLEAADLAARVEAFEHTAAVVNDVTGACPECQSADLDFTLNRGEVIDAVTCHACEWTIDRPGTGEARA